MQRITTATRVVDKFGPGKDGYTDGPPDATQLEAAMFDSFQEEIARVIEGQGIVLDGMVLDQLKQAIDDYAFVDPSITGTLTIENGGDINILSGGSLTADVGSTVTLNGTVTIGGLATFTINADANFMNDVILGDVPADSVEINGTLDVNAPTTFFDDISIGANELSGTAGSIVDVDRVQVTTIELDDSDSTYSQTKGHIRLNDTAYMAANGATQTRAIDDPGRGFDLVFSTANAIADTSATTNRRIQEVEPVVLEVGGRYEIDAAPNNLNYRIQVTGPLGTADLDVNTFHAGTANVGYSFFKSVRWVPTDDFGAETATQGYSFLLRLGTSGGTVTVDDASIKVSSAIQVG